MSRVLWAIALATAGCSSEPALDRATIGNLEYGVPSGWSSRDLSQWERTGIEWRPDADDNEHKESLIILSTERPAMAKATPGYLGKLLGDAQHTLPGAVFSRPTAFTTRHGLAGVRVEGDLVPTSQGKTYRRMHAVIVDGGSLVHVLYTARELDRERFEAVVDSFAKKGA